MKSSKNVASFVNNGAIQKMESVIIFLFLFVETSGMLSQNQFCHNIYIYLMDIEESF